MNTPKRTKILRASFRKINHDVLEIRNNLLMNCRILGLVIVGIYYGWVIIFSGQPIEAIKQSFIADYENIQNMINPDKIIKKKFEIYKRVNDEHAKKIGRRPYGDIQDYNEYKELILETRPSKFRYGYGTIFFYTLVLFLFFAPHSKPVRIDRKRLRVYTRVWGKYYTETAASPGQLYALITRRNHFPRDFILGFSTWTPWFISLEHHNEFFGRLLKNIPIGVWPVMDRDKQGEILYQAINDFLHYRDSENLACIDKNFHPPFFRRWFYARTLFIGSEYYPKTFEKHLDEQVENRTRYNEKYGEMTFGEKLLETEIQTQEVGGIFE